MKILSLYIMLIFLFSFSPFKAYCCDTKDTLKEEEVYSFSRESDYPLLVEYNLYLNNSKVFSWIRSPSTLKDMMRENIDIYFHMGDIIHKLGDNPWGEQSPVPVWISSLTLSGVKYSIGLAIGDCKFDYDNKNHIDLIRPVDYENKKIGKIQFGLSINDKNYTYWRIPIYHGNVGYSSSKKLIRIISTRSLSSDYNCYSLRRYEVNVDDSEVFLLEYIDPMSFKCKVNEDAQSKADINYYPLEDRDTFLTIQRELIKIDVSLGFVETREIEQLDNGQYLLKLADNKEDYLLVGIKANNDYCSSKSYCLIGSVKYGNTP